MLPNGSIKFYLPAPEIGSERTNQTLTIAYRNGAFIVAELCEALIRGDVVTGRKSVKEWFAASDVFKQVEASEGKGKKVLLEKLSLL